MSFAKFRPQTFTREFLVCCQWVLKCITIRCILSKHFWIKKWKEIFQPFFHHNFSSRLLEVFLFGILLAFFFSFASAFFTISSTWVALNLLCKASIILTLPSWNTKTQQYSWSAGPLELFITNDSAQFKQEERTDIHAILSQIKCCLP